MSTSHFPHVNLVDEFTVVSGERKRGREKEREGERGREREREGERPPKGRLRLCDSAHAQPFQTHPSLE